MENGKLSWKGTACPRHSRISLKTLKKSISGKHIWIGRKRWTLMIKENSKAVIGFAKNFLERVTEVYNQIEIDDEW